MSGMCVACQRNQVPDLCTDCTRSVSVVAQVLRAALQAIRGTDVRLDVSSGSSTRMSLRAAQGRGVRVVWERGI